MPSWLIIAIAVVVLVVGVLSSVVIRSRRTTNHDLARAVGALRAREAGLRNRADALAVDGDVAEAERLIDSAAATLSAARAHRSRSALDESARTLDLAEAELDQIGGR